MTPERSRSALWYRFVLSVACARDRIDEEALRQFQQVANIISSIGKRSGHAVADANAAVAR